MAQDFAQRLAGAAIDRPDMIAPLLPILTALAGVSLAAHLRAEYRGPHWQIYLFKPLTTALLLTVAFLAPGPRGVRYHASVAVGLALSLIGDIWLMLPRDRFVPGLGSFLLAHLAYLFAFTAAVPFGAAPALLLPLLGLGVTLLCSLWTRLGHLRVPVLVYAVVLVAMTWQAMASGWVLRTPGTALAAAGGGLFFMSDAVLALRRFRGTFRFDQAVIMLTYVVAQALIAWSVAIT